MEKFENRNQSTETNHCKLLVFNDSNDVFFALTGKQRVAIDNKNAGKLKRNEYMIINLQKGKHELSLEHWDLFVFKSKHEINLMNDTNYISIKASPTSNSIEILNSLPEKFEKRYKKRKE
ncbi:MAG TPA: hypothetical protein VKA10_08455 [Prolixibacteraceae bacterium]|nr:hypothetical protein [Prolixibacteraceae bacterium]